MSDDAVNVAIVMDMVNAIHVAVVDDTTLVVDLGCGWGRSNKQRCS